METVEKKKQIMIKAIMGAITPEAKVAMSDRDFAFNRLEKIKDSVHKMRERKEELTVKLDALKSAMVEEIEQGKSLESQAQVAAVIRAEIDATDDLLKDLEADRLCQAKAALDNAEELLVKAMAPAKYKTQEKFQAALTEIVREEVESMILAWPRAVMEFNRDMKLQTTASESRLVVISHRIALDGVRMA